MSTAIKQDTSKVDSAKHAPKRTAAQRAADLAVAEEHHLRGWTHNQIAERLSSIRGYTISRQQVAYDMKKLERQWLSEASQSHAADRSRALKVLALVEQTAWEGWELSKQLGERADVPKPGDSAFLRRILEVHDRRVKILGLDPAQNVAVTLSSTPPTPVFTDEEQEALLERHYERMRRKQPSQTTNEPCSQKP